MAKKIMIADFDINISDILKKIEMLKTSTAGKIDILGPGVVSKTTKSLNQIEQKFLDLRAKMPDMSSTVGGFKKLSEEVGKGENRLEALLQEMQKFSVSDDYLKQNIEGLREFSIAADEAKKKTEELYEKARRTPLSNYSVSGEKQGSLQAERTMRDIVSDPNLSADQKRQQVKDTYRARGDEYASLIKESKKAGDTERTQQLIRDRNLLIAAEKKYLSIITQVEKATLEQSAAEKILDSQIVQSRGAAEAAMQGLTQEAGEVSGAFQQTQGAIQGAVLETRQMDNAAKSVGRLSDRLSYLFSATSVFYTLRRVVRGAIQDFQALDKQFNEIAIVSEYSTKEMWESFSAVNETAQKFGVSSQNVLEVQNLYYHQGKSMAEVNKLTAQTLTLAKITGMDYERATSDLTAALNAYNIAAEDAVRITDTVAAMDTNAAISSEELMTALTKTASIAANAGMSLESTEVFLTKMIETTREAPENLGTALKTIIARFGEVKQEIDGEEIELADINRVDTALKSIGISLLDTAGQIRDLDDVFMELSSKWDDLDRNTQRYIATMAAGSRQQSRFIAMMENYERTLELSEIAQNSAGLGARQLAKSMESIETSVNRLKSTWQEFYSNFLTSGLIKGLLDTANAVLSLINKINDIHPILGGIVTALVLWAVKTQVIDRAIKMLGKTMGEGITLSGTFQTLVSSVVLSLDKEAQAALRASGALDKYTASVLAANGAQKGQVFSGVKQEYYNHGLINEKGKITDKGRQFREENSKRRAKGKNSLSFEKFETRYARTTGYNNMLEKMLGKEGATNFLGNKGAAKGEGIKAFGKNLGKNLSTGLGGAIKGIGASLSGMVGSLGAILSVLWPILAAVLAIGAGIAIWKAEYAASLDDTKKVEKLTKAQEEYNKQLQSYNNLRRKAKEYEEFVDKSGKTKRNLSEEDLQKQQEIAKELVAEYPRLLEKIDEEGNYHLKNAEAIEREIAAKERLVNQSAKTYANLRIENLKHGIYTDTSTQAGQAIKNIQDYAATFGTEKLNKNDDLKEIAKAVDSGSRFDKSAFYDIMEAYAKGEKFSFDEKDFTQLFAGAIHDTEWSKFLDMVADEGRGIFDQDGNIDEDELAQALKDTGAYGSDGTAEEVANTFVKLNTELGGLYGQLLQGAAYEEAEIAIESARIALNQVDFEEEIGADLKDALATAAKDMAKDESGDKWKEMTGEEKSDAAEENINLLSDDLEALTKSEIENLESFINEDVSLSGPASEVIAAANAFSDSAEKDIDDMKDALEEYWKTIPEEIRDSLPELKELIYSESEEIIKTLFYIIKNILEEHHFDEDFNSLWEDFESSLKGYGDAYSLDRDTLYKDFSEKLDAAQMSALVEKASGLSKEELAPYLSTIYNAWEDGEYNSDLFNTLISQDFFSEEGVDKAVSELYKFGYASQDVLELAKNAANGINNISLGHYTDTVKYAKETIESLGTKTEGMTALMSGKGTVEQLDAYITTMSDYWTRMDGAEVAAEKVKELTSSVLMTAEGYQIGADAGLAYSDVLSKVTKEQIETKIATYETALATLKLALTQREATEADRAAILELTQQIGFLKNVLTQVDTQSRVAFQEGLSKDLEDAKEKADELVESLKALVEWLRGYDRYLNLDGVIKTLEEDFDHLDFEINFSTNSDVIKDDLEKTIGNINTQISANQGGLSAAKEEMAMWKDIITRNNSGYISFDANGNVIRNAEKLTELQNQIANADEHQKKVLQAKYDEIMANVEAYEKAKTKVQDYSKALEDNFKKLRDFLDKTYENVSKVEEKLIDVYQKAEDKQLEATKKKYELIKEENDKYLDSVQKMIDKEREIRDRADKEEDVKDKERKLAMMKMDTSGVYKNEIQTLENDLKDDYQSLEDDLVDKSISDLEETFSGQSEQYDRDIQYFENALEYKREKMTEYNQWANDLLRQGSDAVLAYLQANDEEYYTGTAAQKAAWTLEWQQAVELAVGSNEWMRSSLHDTIFNALNACTSAAGGFEEGVKSYSQVAMASNGQIEGTVESLTGYYEGLAEKVGDVEQKMIKLRNAYSQAAGAAAALKSAQNGIFGADVGALDGSGNDYNGGNETGEWYRTAWGGSDGHYIGDTGNVFNYLVWTGNREDAIEYKGTTYYKITRITDGETGWVENLYLDDSGVYRPSPAAKIWDFQKKRNHGGSGSRFATGGLADYTGPAWLDGTPSKPEAVLNPLQTKHFIQFTNVLDSLFSNKPFTEANPQSSQKTGDISYNFNIQVEQMSNDYDVDKMVSRLEEKMIKAGQYRNVNVVKKTK